MRNITPLLILVAACAAPLPMLDPDAAAFDPDAPPLECNGDDSRCEAQTFQRCVDGRWVDEVQCDFPKLCDDNLACLDCDPQIPTLCVGDDVRECRPDGTVGGTVTTCALESCVNGECTDPCGKAASRRSYIGCEYWPVDLPQNVDIFGEPIPVAGSECTIYASTLSDVTWTQTTVNVCVPGSGLAGNSGFCDYGGDCSLAGGGSCQPMELCLLDAQHAPFAVVVSNPDEVEPVDVTLSNADGMTYTTTVAPGAVVPIYPQAVGFPDQSCIETGVESKAYRLVSTRPIVAYQFNPLQHEGVFSNDGSLLLPAHTFDTRYYAASWPTLVRRPQRHDANSFVTVVASQPGVTAVTVLPTAPVRAGVGMAAFGIGALRTFELAQYQTLNLEAAAGGDLTGTFISSDKPVGVFSGHEATTLSPTTPAPCCMDHLEDQLFPASSWGKEYVVARLQSRKVGESDLVRILAQQADTVVTFDPPTASCPTLAPGAYCDVWIQADVTVTANQPILVAHYMSSIGGTEADSGDPALSFAVPTEQYRTEYTLLVPDTYFFNYFGLVAPAGARIFLDGQEVTALATFGAGAYATARVLVEPGQHRLECPDGCGVEVYGWSDAVSYLFAGGLDLRQIVIP